MARAKGGNKLRLMRRGRVCAQMLPEEHASLSFAEEELSSSTFGRRRPGGKVLAAECSEETSQKVACFDASAKTYQREWMLWGAESVRAHTMLWPAAKNDNEEAVHAARFDGQEPELELEERGEDSPTPWHFPPIYSARPRGLRVIYCKL